MNFIKIADCYNASGSWILPYLRVVAHAYVARKHGLV